MQPKIRAIVYIVAILILTYVIETARTRVNTVIVTNPVSDSLYAANASLLSELDIYQKLSTDTKEQLGLANNRIINLNRIVASLRLTIDSLLAEGQIDTTFTDTTKTKIDYPILYTDSDVLVDILLSNIYDTPDLKTPDSNVRINDISFNLPLDVVTSFDENTNIFSTHVRSYSKYAKVDTVAVFVNDSIRLQKRAGWLIGGDIGYNFRDSQPIMFLRSGFFLNNNNFTVGVSSAGDMTIGYIKKF